MEEQHEEQVSEKESQHTDPRADNKRLQDKYEQAEQGFIANCKHAIIFETRQG